MARLIEHIKRWNVWRKYNKNGIAHKVLVLFGIIRSPTFLCTWTADEAQAFYDGFMAGLKTEKLIDKYKAEGFYRAPQRNRRKQCDK